MKKINFENLPSTNTPINAANLNQIQSNIEEVFSGAETMGNIVVSDIKCKNLFNTSLIVGTWVNGALVGVSGYTTIRHKISVQPNTTYTLSSKDNNVVFDGNLIFYDSSGTMLSQIYDFDTFTTPANCYYITWHSVENYLPLNAEIQLEEGSEATEYTPHKSFDGTGILLSKFASAMEGFTILDETIHKQGNHYFGTIIIKKDEGDFSSTQDIVLELPIKIPKAVNSFCCLTNSEWQANIMGYFYISSSNSRVSIGNFVGGSYNIAKIEINLMSI